MDPKRLLKEGDAFERALLRSAERDVIPAQSRNAILGTLGVGVVAPPALIALETLTEASPNPVPIGSPNVAPPPSPPIAPPAATVAGGKGVIAAASAAAVGAAAIWAGVTLNQEPQPVTPPPDSHVVIEEVVPAPVTVEEAEEPEVAPEEEPSTPKASTKKATPSGNTKTETDPLVRELTLIDRARRALRSNNPSLALKRLDAYNAAFPKGSLQTEQTVLRIEALVARGDHSTASRLGRSFLKRSPNGPYARRVRSLLGETTDQRSKD